MIFIPLSDGIFYLDSIKKFVLSLEKDCFDRVLKHFKQKTVRNKLLQKFASFMQSKCFYIIWLTSRKLYPTFPNWPTCACSYGKFSSHLGGGPGKIKWDPTYSVWLTSHMNTLYFYMSFLKKLASHLGANSPPELPQSVFLNGNIVKP